MKKKKYTKPTLIKLEVTEWINEEKFAEPADVRKKEKERIKGLYSQI